MSIYFNIGLELEWCVVFFCRLWWVWLQHKKFVDASNTTTEKKRESKYKQFITRTAYPSVEINAHMLLYLVLLVKEHQLPKEALYIYLFNSQSCESMFRNTRPLSGVFSTAVNFTANDFLRRSQKLSTLNKIKHQQENKQNEIRLNFPVHHKHRNDNHLVVQEKLEDICDLDIDKIIFNSYKMAVDLIKPFNVIPILKDHHILGLDSLSKYVFSYFNSK